MNGAETIEPAVLSAADGPAVEVLNPTGAGSVVLVCEHAARRLPATLGTLGLDDAALQSHIAWDPGALALARRMSAALDAPLLAARFSRLAYDCNRPPEADDAVVAAIETYRVPGNSNLSALDRAAREREIYRPFQRALGALIEARLNGGATPVPVTVHSFSPTWFGEPRHVGIGVLHDDDRRLADALLDRLAPLEEITVARNVPYGPEDGVTHTLRLQALPRGLLNVMLEVRSDLIADAAGAARLDGLLTPRLVAALDQVRPGAAGT